MHTASINSRELERQTDAHFRWNRQPHSQQELLSPSKRIYIFVDSRFGLILFILQYEVSRLLVVLSTVFPPAYLGLEYTDLLFHM